MRPEQDITAPMAPKLQHQSILGLAIWAALAVAFVAALSESRWSLAFIALATFALTLLPVFFAGRFGVRLPTSFVAGIVLIIFATIFFSEAFEFYDERWWWKIALHSGSAISIGLVGFLFIFMVFDGNRYAAPPWAIAFFTFSFAVAGGTLWEVFPYALDGFDIPQSGQNDTIWDLIVNVGGATLAAAAGFLYLKGWWFGGLTRPIAEFIRANRRPFRKAGK